MIERQLHDQEEYDVTPHEAHDYATPALVPHAAHATATATASNASANAIVLHYGTDDVPQYKKRADHRGK